MVEHVGVGYEGAGAAPPHQQAEVARADDHAGPAELVERGHFIDLNIPLYAESVVEQERWLHFCP